MLRLWKFENRRNWRDCGTSYAETPTVRKCHHIHRLVTMVSDVHVIWDGLSSRTIRTAILNISMLKEHRVCREDAQVNFHEMQHHLHRLWQQVDVFMGSIGSPQLRGFFPCYNYEEAWYSSLLAVAVVVFALRKTIAPCNMKMGALYRETETLSCYLVPTNE